MAILWWIATGTHKKMESDVKRIYRGHDLSKPNLMLRNEPLNIHHVLLQTVLLGFGLIISALLFFGELLFYMNRKHKEGETVANASEIEIVLPEPCPPF